MNYLDIDTTIKNNFKVGMMVDVQENDKIYRGYIKKILSNDNQDKGIKVLLENGHSGRIYGVPSKAEIEKQDFKFFNLFFNSETIYVLLKDNEVFTISSNNKNCAYLFSSKEKALKAVQGTPLENKPYHTNKLTRKKNITELLAKYNIDIFVIDMKRQLTNQELNDLEIKFRSM